MNKSIRIKIYGRVQGVGFRRWGRKTAADIGGLSGWIRNCDDGAVEILVRGDESALDSLILRCQQGPLLARVDKIELAPGVAVGFLPDIEEGRFVII